MKHSFRFWGVAALLTVAALTMGGVVAPTAAAERAAAAEVSERGQVSAEDASLTATPTLPPATLPSATVGHPFSYRFDWSGDSIHAATKLPEGLTLSRDGVLSGTPVLGIVGNNSFRISASTSSGEADEWPESVTRSFTLTVVQGSLPPLDDVQGTIPEVSLGQAYSYQVPLVGQSARVQSSNRPGWLQVDSTGKLTGTAPTNPAEVVGRSVTIVVEDAFGRTYTYASPIAVRDIREVVVKSEWVPGSTMGKIWGACPANYPYIALFKTTFRDQRYGFPNDLAPGYINPGGVKINAPTGLAVSTYSAGRDVVELDPNEWGTNKKATAQRHKEISGNYMNWNIVPSYLTVSMLCTSDPFGHGTSMLSVGSP